MQTRDITRSRWWMPGVRAAHRRDHVRRVRDRRRRHPGRDLLRRSWPLFGAAFLLGRRGETLRGIGGPERDERWEAIDLRAVAYTGLVLIVCIIGGFLYEVARGEDGSPYTLLGAIGGLAYVLSVALLRRRS